MAPKSVRGNTFVKSMRWIDYLNKQLDNRRISGEDNEGADTLNNCETAEDGARTWRF